MWLFGRFAAKIKHGGEGYMGGGHWDRHFRQPSYRVQTMTTGVGTWRSAASEGVQEGKGLAGMGLASGGARGEGNWEDLV